jgi:hypothetical protein
MTNFLRCPSHRLPALLIISTNKSVFLLFRVNFRGVSKTSLARQSVLRKDEKTHERVEIQAVIHTVHHPYLINAHGESFSDYFRLHILHSMRNR